MKYNVSQILKAKEALASLPKVSIESKEQVTSMEAIVLLAGELSSLQKKGYTTELLVKALHDQGIDVSVSTLRRYLRQAGASPLRKTKEKPKSDRLPTKARGKAAVRDVVETAAGVKPAIQVDNGAATKSSKFPVRGDTDEL